MTYLVVIIAGIVGFLLGWTLASRNRDGGLISRQSENKERNKKAIFELLTNPSTSLGASQPQITNNDVEAMLGISDATATRYFDELEKEGKVRQVGKTGRHVHYERT